MELKRYLRVVASTGDDDDDYSMVEISNRRAREAADHIEKLEAGEIEFDRVIGNYASENAQFRGRIEKLEAALQWYAEHCQKGGDEIEGPFGDYGQRASKALEGKDD